MIFAVAFGVPLLLLAVIAVASARRRRRRARALTAALESESQDCSEHEISARRFRTDIRTERAMGRWKPPLHPGEGYDGAPLAPENGE